jgi:hypothetical protein
MSELTPDAMIEYCTTQLDGIDSEISADITQQKLEIRERTAVNQVKAALEQFGTNGPTNGDDMQKCVDAFNQATSSLPPGDPVAAQLTTQCKAMVTNYGFHPEHVATGTARSGGPLEYGVAPEQMVFTAGQRVAAKLDTPPSNGQWQGDLDALGNIADNIKSGAEIQLLQLNSLVSQRQQAVQLATGMIGKLDDTLENEVRSIGRS